MVAIAVDEPAPLLKRLDPPRRATVVMALVGLVVLGLGLVALVMLGGWFVRRRARQRARPTEARGGSPFAGPMPPPDAADDLRRPPGLPNGPARDGP
jgi:hypothetical protein